MLNVLIVEDDLVMADLLQEALELDGYIVSGIARTVKEAIQAAEARLPDFAVIDIQLAHGDLGLDVGAHLRATAKTAILFSTGNDTTGLTTRLGDAVMTKPYRLADVGRGLKILAELGESGHTRSEFPRNFRLLEPELAWADPI
jgi:DNA-binding response OmpR family regulator